MRLKSRSRDCVDSAGRADANDVVPGATDLTLRRPQRSDPGEVNASTAQCRLLYRRKALRR